MPSRREVILTTLAATASGAVICAAKLQESPKMESAVNSELVISFLNHFEEVAMKEDFSLLSEMIDEQAYFRFNDGDYIGRKAIQTAFEKTWRGDPTIKKARFYLSDIVVLTTDKTSASATYTYNWEGSQGSQEFKIQGRGTRVLSYQNGKFRIVHEHLSRRPSIKAA